jgi:hypothetical protein
MEPAGRDLTDPSTYADPVRARKSIESKSNSLCFLPHVRDSYGLGRRGKDLVHKRLGGSTVAAPGPAVGQRCVHDEEGRLRCRCLGRERLCDGIGRFGGDLERHVGWL